MVEQASFVHGSVTYPLVSTLGNSLLQDADPSLFYITEYFSSVLKTYVEPRLLAECAAAGINVISKAVFSTLAYDPAPYLVAQVATFPLLAIWRKSEKDRARTVAFDEDIGTWSCAYILPPLSKLQMDRIFPILRSVSRVIADRINNKRDPAYRSGANFMALAGLEEMSLKSGSYGRFEVPDKEFVYPAWVGELEVRERDGYLPVAATGGQITGMDVETDLVSGGSTPINDFVDVKIDVPNPTTIPTLEVFYRSDVGISLNANQALVVNWADQSGHGYSATPIAPSNRPIVEQDATSGKNIVRFDGVQTYLTSSDSALAVDTGKTLVVAFRLWDIAARSSLAIVTDTTVSGTLAFEANSISTAGSKLGIFAAGSSFDTQFTTDNQWHVAVVRVTSSVSGGSISTTTKVQIDDLPAVLTLKSGSGLWAGLLTSTTFSLGGLSSDLTNTAAHADIGVAMAFSSRLSDADTASAVSFCKQWLAGNV